MAEYPYTHVSRRDLRRMLASRVGFDPSGDSYAQNIHALNEFIRSGALKAAEQFHHYYAREACVIDVGEEQGEIAYPCGCGPGSIVQLSIWIDEDTRAAAARYCPVFCNYPTKAFVPLVRIDTMNDWDKDPAWDAGGTDMEEVVGTPVAWTVRDRILFRPLTDQAYKLKVLYTRAPELLCDDDITSIDGELILRYATSEFYRQAEEFSNADRWEADAEKRVRYLRGMQGSGQIRNFQSDISFRLSPEEEAALGGAADCPHYDYSALGQGYAPTAERTVNPE